MGPTQGKPASVPQQRHPPIRSGLRQDAVPGNPALIADPSSPNSVGTTRVPGSGGTSSSIRTGSGSTTPAAKHVDPLASAPKVPEVTLPVVIRFSTTQFKGSGAATPAPKAVNLVLKYNQWKPVPMTKSGDDFYAIANLPKGQHAYKFTLENSTDSTIDKSQQVQMGEDGQPVNIVMVSDRLVNYDVSEEKIANEQFGQKQTAFEETRKFPPLLPPHLRYTPLNTPPSQVRVGSDGVIAHNNHFLDPENLPLPLSVTLNHVYFQRREDHIVAGVTTRYRTKFSTIVYYRGNSSTAVTT